MIEMSEQGQEPRNAARTAKETYDSPLGKFEVDVVPEIRSEDIGADDRAFILTQSGNRYMIRHSKGRSEALVIYDERKEGFDANAAHPFMVRKENGQKGPIARVGIPLNVFAITDEKTEKGTEWNSTPVTRIEIRRGIEAAIRKVTAAQGTDGESLFGGIANAIARMGDARSTPAAEEVNPLDPKYRKK